MPGIILAEHRDRSSGHDLCKQVADAGLRQTDDLLHERGVHPLDAAIDIEWSTHDIDGRPITRLVSPNDAAQRSWLNPIAGLSARARLELVVALEDRLGMQIDKDEITSDALHQWRSLGEFVDRYRAQE
jgi:hypothetical protein